MSKHNKWRHFRSLLLCGIAAVTSCNLPSTLTADDSLRLSILDLPRFNGEEAQVIALIRTKRLEQAEALLRAMTKRYPKSPTVQYNLACVLSLGGRIDESFGFLTKAVELGFRKVDHLKQDTDLINIRKDARFATVLKAAAVPMDGKAWPQFDQASISVGENGAVQVTESNVGFNQRNGMFMALVRPEAGLAEKPIMKEDGKVSALLAKWYEAGTAAGNAGDLYDNHDGDHSNMKFEAYPQLTRIEFGPAIRQRQLHSGLQRHFIFSGITLGNSSTALTKGKYWRSQARGALTQPNGASRLALHYLGNHLYFYPEHRDHDVGHNGNGGGYGDVFPANTPYLVVSQGSSGSDRAFMDAFAATLAAFRPEVKKKLALNGMLISTMQMIFRRSNSHLQNAKEYFNGKAHPTVFDSKHLDVVRMIRRAHSIEIDSLPPFAQFKVAKEDLPVPNRDYFDFRPHQRLFDTPCAVARVYKTTAPIYSLTLDAQSSRDINGKPLIFRWVVLRGDGSRIEIEKLEDKGSVVEVRVPWHDRRPVLPGSALESNRVDVGLFVGNGDHWSAPAILSVYFPDNQKRTFAEDGRIESIDYSIDNYVDPFLENSRNWRDDYRYDDKGNLLGWTRFRKDEADQQFSVDGHLVLEATKDGTPIRTVPVRYIPKKIEGDQVIIEQSPPR
tara:strand:- start:1398 stop:3410 length:2013 start_codon:yes stop_codon:yes gene_type:complete